MQDDQGEGQLQASRKRPALATQLIDRPEAPPTSGKRTIRFSSSSSDEAENESLLAGFILLRLAQLLNVDVHYIGQAGQSEPRPAAQLGASLISVAEPAAGQPIERDVELGELGELAAPVPCGWSASGHQRGGRAKELRDTRPNLLDELAAMNPFGWLAQRCAYLGSACRLLKICLSLVAIMVGVDKTISTILLCLLSRPDVRSRPGNVGLAYETSDVTMSWFVLVLINVSSMYILFSTVFNGHLLWRLLSQRLFLVGRHFQYRTMLSLIVFVYLEYIVNISFVNNLFGWPFEAPDDQPDGGGGVSGVSGASGASGVSGGGGGGGGGGSPTIGANAYNIHTSYSVLSKLEIFVTEKSERNALVDILLTIFQFARGIIRISPYITINYVTICLNEHVKTIRNQTLLTDSLKKRQKLRLVVKQRRANDGALSPAPPTGQNKINSISSVSSLMAAGQSHQKKHVIFVTETGPAAAREPDRRQTQLAIDWGPATSNGLEEAPAGGWPAPAANRSPSPISLTSTIRSVSSLGYGHQANGNNLEQHNQSQPAAGRPRPPERSRYLNRIEDFDELESYITNLYIFTDRLNRLMSLQGLAVFVIVHNLVITCTLIVPEAISGGPFMASLVRVLVIGIGIVPFISGQALNGQLGQLSKQIDRIIIQQQFIGRKRDNLVRIRELLHDIRINCAGMLNFNVETGIKYLVVAFASAFFIEQEGKCACCCPGGGGGGGGESGPAIA